MLTATLGVLLAGPVAALARFRTVVIFILGLLSLLVLLPGVPAQLRLILLTVFRRTGLRARLFAVVAIGGISHDGSFALHDPAHEKRMHRAKARSDGCIGFKITLRLTELVPSGPRIINQSWPQISGHQERRKRTRPGQLPGRTPWQRKRAYKLTPR